MLSLERTQLCAYTLALALGLSALGAGAVHLPVLAVCGLLVLAAGFIAVFSGDGGDRPRSGQRELVGSAICFGLAVYCLLQAVPLPFAWLKAIAPSNADVWERALELLGVPAAQHASLSLAPRRTLVEALQLAIYGVVFAVGARFARWHGMHRIALVAFGCALAVALVTAVHQLSGATSLYGVYRPLDAYSIAPLLNANSRAGYLNLGFFCGLGILFRSGMRPLAALIGCGLVVLAAQILLCESVGGTASLALGLALVLVLPRGGRRGEQREQSRALQAGILLVIATAALFMAFVAGNRNLGLDDRSLEKLELLERSSSLISDHFWLGIGRGAFGSVFAAYQGPGANVSFEHAENFLVQWASEWGVPVTLVAIAGWLWVMRPALRVRALASPTRRCVWVGCGVLLLQNLVDLGLELPAVAAMLACVLGGLCGAAAESRAADAPERASPMKANGMIWGGSALTSVCLVLALVFGIESPWRLRHELHAELSATQGAPPPSFWSALHEAIEAYPAEPYFPLIGASASLAAKRNAMPWIARALERKPESATAHLQLGRILHARGATSQGLGALRRAVELDPALALRALRLGQSWGVAPSALEAVAPEGSAGAPVLLLLARQVEDRKERLRLLDKAVHGDPGLADAHYYLASELTRDVELEAGGVVCAAARDSCLARAMDHAKRSHVPGSSRSGILEARILARQGRSKEAEQLLAAVCEQLPGDDACRNALVAQAFANQSPALDDAIKGLIATACSDRERCGATHLKLGNKFASAGQWHVALGHYRRAAEETPSTEAWQTLAQAAQRLGYESVAQEAERRVRLLEAGDARHQAPLAPRAPSPSEHPPPSEDDSTAQQSAD